MDEEKNVGQDGSELKDKAKQGADKAKSAVNNLASLPGKAEAFAENATKVANTARKAHHVKTAAAATKAATTATKVAAISSSIVSVLWPIVLIILILFITIGLIVFLLSGMGFIFKGIQDISNRIGNYFTSITKGAEYVIQPSEMEDTMNFLVGLDYDLYGYGFVEEMPGFSYELNENKQTDENGNELDTESGRATVTLNSETFPWTGNYEKAITTKDYPNPYRYLTAYMVSDNYGNLIKNYNTNFKAMLSSDRPWMVFFGEDVDSAKWGSGLMSFFYEKDDTIGKKGNDISGSIDVNPILLIPGSTIKQGIEYLSGYLGASVTVNNGKLIISTGGSSNIKFKYDMDGWIGRYGMPLEFLLSTHVATMAPDLSYRLATSFNTDVEILLHKSDKDKKDSNGKPLTQVKSGVVLKSRDDIKDPSRLTADEGKDKNIITKDDIDEAMGGAKDFFNISKNDVMKIFAKTAIESEDESSESGGIESAPGCVGNGDDYVNKTSSEVSINLNDDWEDYDKSLLIEKDNIDYICNVREEIKNNIINLLKGDDKINKSTGLQEISMDELVREAREEGGDVDEGGIITGTVKNNYTFDENSTDTENKYIGTYIEEKVKNDIKADELVDVKPCWFEDNKDSWEDDLPYRAWNNSMENKVFNFYDPIENKHSDLYYINEEQYSKLNNPVADICAPNVINVIWNYCEDMKNWIEDYYEYSERNPEPIYIYNSRDYIYNSRYCYSHHDTIWYGNQDYDCVWSALAWTRLSLYDNNQESNNLTNDVYHFENELEGVNKFSNNVNDELKQSLDELYKNKYNKPVQDSTTWDKENDIDIIHNYDDEETDRDTKYMYKGQEKTEEDTKKLFKWTKEQNYSLVKKQDALKFFDNTGDARWSASNFACINEADLNKITKLYAKKDVEAFADKPILKKNDETWNFSFYNRTTDDENYFITISVSTGAKLNASDDDEYKKYENEMLEAYLTEEDGEYQIDFPLTDGKVNMGAIQISYNTIKLSDEKLKKATSNNGEIESCSDLAKKMSEDELKNAQCCPLCYNYVKQIYKALRTMQETEMSTYVPYINRVTDHWFRNVYFTKEALDATNKEKSKKGEEQDHIIQPDDAYEEATGERWTLYDTYEDENGDVQYELYVFLKDDNGEFKTSFEKSGDSYVVCKKVNDGSGKYIVDEDGTTYKLAKDEDGKSIKGEFKLQLKTEENSYSDYGDTPEEFRVGKRAILNENIPSDYKAYSADEVQHDTGWQMLDPADEDKELLNSDLLTILEDYKDLTLVSRAKYLTVEQKEDGLRGETNAKIKNIFLDNYYIFDGSIERASAIQNAKRKVFNKFKQDGNNSNEYDNPDEFRKIFPDQPITPSYKSSSTDVNEGGLPNIYSIDDISGNISIAQESLNAFAMLKNMKTLDAEYIYHDFKELIVELNYFNKEDLLEGEQTVMMFPVAGINSEGWVDAKNDKNPNYYGTLIHSADDYKALEKIDEAEAEVEKDSNNNSDDDSEYKRTGKGSNFHRDTFSKTAKVCWEHVVGTGDNRRVYDYEDNLSVTIPLGAKRKINANGFVSWVLYEYGYESFKGPAKSFSFGDINTYNEKYGWDAKILDGDCRSEIKAGDIIVKSSSYAAIVSSVTKSEDGEIVVKGYDCSKSGNWSSENLLGVDITNMVKVNTSTMRIRISVDEEKEEYEGFEGGEPVIAPVSGQIIDYGTTKRTNIETGEKEEEVGFIKIKVFNINDENFVENHKDPDSIGNASDFLKGNYSSEELKILGYDYFKEEYLSPGILGNVLYIEGFNVEEILDNVGKKEENIKKLKEYIESGKAPNMYSTLYKVPNLLNNISELKLKVKEQAKKRADFVFEDNGKIYIKEGAVIGYTYTKEEAEDKDITKEKTVQIKDNSGSDTTETVRVGNYLRLILRDLDDEVVENVEEYIEKGYGNNGDWDSFLYWMGPNMEGVTVVKKDGAYYAKVEAALDDGKGVTAAFGITSDNDSLIASLGYSWRVADLKEGDLIPLEENVNVYLAIVDQKIQEVKNSLGRDNIPIGYLQSFVSVLYNYGNLTERGTYYQQYGYVPEALWTTYEGDDEYKEGLTKRRKAEWAIITQGIYSSDGENEIGYIIDNTEKNRDYSYAEPTFSYWCQQHNIMEDTSILENIDL